MANCYSFIGIFKQYKSDDGKNLPIKIVIPMIQRDYAQGRENVKKVRDRFLDSLYGAVVDENKNLNLDFVYGDLKNNGDKGLIMTPLDGQQRLTTLFLLHWYAAKKAKVPEVEYGFLYNFSYETRASARDFCHKLVENLEKFNPSDDKLISEEIRDQSWFPLDWENDPTVKSMLVMLDAIDEKFKGAADILWKRLNGDAITFYFLPIRDMGETDDLYIKMNSRGKKLTDFEQLKAELESQLKKIDPNTADEVINCFDNSWTDLLWNYCKDDYKTADEMDEGSTIDSRFLNYFRYICDSICYKQGDIPNNKKDVFDLAKDYFSVTCVNVKDNIKTMQNFFNCWCGVLNGGYKSLAEYFNTFMSVSHEAGKIVIKSDKSDIFKRCIDDYVKFTNEQKVLLYAIIFYLNNKDVITEDQFRRRIRIINNLVQNSEDEFVDRSSRSNMPAIISQTEYIMSNGEINDTLRASFNGHQLDEEREKIDFLKLNPTRAEELFRLEDHKLLYGQIGIIGLDNLDFGDKFISLFECEYDKVNRALMAEGNFGQRDKNQWRYQFATKNLSAWQVLFHKSNSLIGFEKTGKILVDLLKKYGNFDNALLDKIARDYIDKCNSEKSYPWEYYYVAYDCFRTGYSGRMRYFDDKNEPYMFVALVGKGEKKMTDYSYMPYLKEADEGHMEKWRESRTPRLAYGDRYICCTNGSYEVYQKLPDGTISDKPTETIVINQTNGTDSEDRIEVLKNYIKDNS